MTIVSMGEILWDVFKDSEMLGGASLNFAAHAGRLGHRLIFVSAVGDDEHGQVASATQFKWQSKTKRAVRT